MKDAPNAFYAVVFVLMSCAVAIVALYAPYRENTTMAVITMATSIVAGAFGYIQGHQQGFTAGKATVQPPGDPATTTKETEANGDSQHGA